MRALSFIEVVYKGYMGETTHLKLSQTKAYPQRFPTYNHKESLGVPRWGKNLINIGRLSC